MKTVIFALFLIFGSLIAENVQAQYPPFIENITLSSSNKRVIVPLAGKYQEVYSYFTGLEASDTIWVYGLTNTKNGTIPLDSIPLFMINTNSPTITYGGAFTGITATPFEVFFYKRNIYALLFRAGVTLAKTLPVVITGRSDQ